MCIYAPVAETRSGQQSHKPNKQADLFRMTLSPTDNGTLERRMPGRFFNNCGATTASTSSHHVQTRLKIILAQMILPFLLPHVLSHFIVCSHAAAAEQLNEVDFSLVLIQCKSCRLTTAVNHNVSPLRYELTTKPAGLLCTAVQLLIARKIRRSPPFTKQADVATETVKYFKALCLIGLEVWPWREQTRDNSGIKEKPKDRGEQQHLAINAIVFYNDPMLL